MPTNLPPIYFNIEKRFREAETIEEKIETLQEMMSVVPKHKGTEHLLGDLKRRLAKLKEEAQKPKSGAKHDIAFHFSRAGAGQVVVIGPRGVGKTSLVAALAGVELDSPTAPPPTWEPAPYMMRFENIQIQLIDTPPLSREHVEPSLKDLIRRVDLLLLVVDLQQDPIAQLLDAASLLEEYRVVAAHRKERYADDQLLKFIPFLVWVNKCDDDQAEESYHIFCELLDEKWPCLPGSVVTGRNLDRLKRQIVDALDILRVYTKVPGKEADLSAPFVFKKGSTLEELAARIHKDFLQKMKFARVWGKTVFEGQMVQRDYVLQDGDVVEIHA